MQVDLKRMQRQPIYTKQCHMNNQEKGTYRSWWIGTGKNHCQ